MEFDPEMFSGVPKKENTAEQRAAMVAIHDFFVNLLEAGFTEHQAIGIMGTMMRPQQ